MLSDSATIRLPAPDEALKTVFFLFLKRVKNAWKIQHKLEMFWTDPRESKPTGEAREDHGSAAQTFPSFGPFGTDINRRS